MISHAKASPAGSNSGLSKGLGFSRLRPLVFFSLAIALIAALSASPALAEETHPYTGVSFGPKGPGDAATFQNVVGLAVDPANNNVYVYDGFGKKIYKFDSAGNPVDFAGLGKNELEVGQGSVGETEIAVAPPGSPGGTAGDLYVTRYPVVRVYSPAGVQLGEISGGELCGSAVSPAGHVFVGNYPSTVEEYVPTGNAPFAAEQVGASSADLSALELCNVAADGLGNVYAANYEGSHGVVKLAGLGAASAIQLDPVGRTVATDPANNDVYVNHGDSVAHYDSFGAELNVFGSGLLVESAAVAVNGASGRVYVPTGEAASGAPHPGRVEAFGPLGIVPDVKAEAATAVTPVEATLNGTVNPDGLAVTNCKFEYSVDLSFGETAPCEGAIPTDSSDHPVTASLSGLQPETTYHFRLAATNANGVNVSADQTFDSANAAFTGQATPIGGVKATLNGIVFPQGEVVSECTFEYGETASYGKTASCAETIPADQGEHAVSAAITHLIPNGSTYHYRLVINRPSGIVQGVDRPFKTKETVITGAASAISPPTATIEGTVNPEGIALSECFFEYTSGTFESGSPSSIPCAESPATIGTGNSPVSVHAGLSGLAFEARYSYRLVATNVDGSAKGKVNAFDTPGVPLIQSQQAAGVTDTKAELVARINPKGLATTYHLEYGLTTAYGQSTAEAPVGGDETLHVLTNLFEGLTPNTTYHWRAVAVNSHGKTEGPDRTFTTYPPFNPQTSCPNQALRSGASANLPDCRAYELVSPAKKIGQVFPPEPKGHLGGSCNECQPGTIGDMSPMQATADGEAIVYQGTPFSANLASGPNQYLAHRSASGWATQSLSSPLFAKGAGQAYKNFSADLTRSVIYQISPVLSPDAPSREGRGFANLYLRGEDGSLQPLITEEPPNRDPGLHGDESTAGIFRLFYGAANSGTASAPALSHVIFEANDALTAASADAPAAPDLGIPAAGVNERNNLYEWVGGQLRLINVTPGNVGTIADPALGGGRAGIGGDGLRVDHAISDDGSRIFWSDKATGQVYVRIDGKETRKIEDPGKFLTASVDGDKVLLDDGCLYDPAAAVCEEDLTQGQGGFQGILGAAEDLSRVYFVDTKVLTGDEENANEEAAETAKFNLYAWDQGDTSFIGGLRFEDNHSHQYGDWKPTRTERTAQVSPDGRYLAFMSQAPLTGYDNRQAGNGTSCDLLSVTPEPEPPCMEIFEYDAVAGGLSCASCNPANQQPIGDANLSLISTVVYSATVPSPLPQPNNLLPDGEGRLFFESQDQLTPRDTNGNVSDVYEWKPNGVGGCTRAAGCIDLISSGHSTTDSFFLNANPNGHDVFIVTREQLLGADKDDFVDLYDARVNGGISENLAPPCLGEACKGPSTSAPEQAGPGSSTFAGPGNEKPKKQKHKKKRRKHAHKHKSQKRAAKHNSGGPK